MPTLSLTGSPGSIGWLGSIGLTALTGLTGLTGLMVAALAGAALVLLLRRRRTDAAGAGRPRTVADLVRLRAEAAASEIPPAVAVPAPVEPAEFVPADEASMNIEPVDDVGAEPESGPAAAGPAAEPEVVPDPAATEAPTVASVPSRVPGSAGDTPWARAARMAGDDDSVWIPLAEAAPPAPAPLSLPSPVIAAVPPVADLPQTPVTDPPPDFWDDDWAGWVESDEVDGDDDGRGPARAGAHLPLTAAPAPATATTVAADPDMHAAPSDDDEVAAPPRARRSAEDTVATHVAADLALLRTFGFADPTLRPDNAPVLSVVPAGQGTTPVDGPGPAQSVHFRALARDGSGVVGAAVALLDDGGRECSTAISDTEGRGTLGAPRPGTYVVVSTAPHHQPGVVALTVSDAVSDAVVEAVVLLARSAALSGSVFGEGGPITGARLTLVQDGEIVDAVDSAADGTFRIGDLGAGEYGLSVVAAGCEPIAVVVDMADGADLQHDVELDPAGPSEKGLPICEDDRIDDLMIGRR